VSYRGKVTFFFIAALVAIYGTFMIGLYRTLFGPL
jgi:hypothetical protein